MYVAKSIPRLKGVASYIYLVCFFLCSLIFYEDLLKNSCSETEMNHHLLSIDDFFVWHELNYKTESWWEDNYKYGNFHRVIASKMVPNNFFSIKWLLLQIINQIGVTHCYL